MCIRDRKDIELVILSEEKRKDKEARRECLNSSDISILCLPDDAAREAVSLLSLIHISLFVWDIIFQNNIKMHPVRGA